MHTKSSWHRLSIEKPQTQGPYWIYMPSCFYRNGILMSYWDGQSFDFEDENEEITHYQEIVRPQPPKFLEKNVKENF